MKNFVYAFLSFLSTIIIVMGVLRFHQGATGVINAFGSQVTSFTQTAVSAGYSGPNQSHHG